MEPKKTHREVKEPQISVQALADYMGAQSERGKRAVVQACRYRANARVIQHNEGKAVCATFLRKGDHDVAALLARAEEVRHKLADDEFEATVNEHNADLIKQFAGVAGAVHLPVAAIERGLDYKALQINGVKISMRANLVLRRTTKTNKLKVGAMMFRYSKGKPLPPLVGVNQAAAIFGFLRGTVDPNGADPEKSLCVVLDGFCGQLYPAPGGSIDIWNDMKAACLSIAERWPNIKPPKGAVL
jgi:hypothetical protein